MAHVDSLPLQPSADTKGGAALARSLAEGLPETGAPAAELLDFLFDRVIPKSFNTAGPGYLAYIPGGGLPQSAVADLVADATNRYVGVFAAAPGLAQLESNVVRWFCDLAGLPRESRGILTSGGSLATFSALVAARRDRLPEDFLSGTIYVSDQAHHAIQKAAILAGFPEHRVREIETDAVFRIRMDALAAAVAADRAAGLSPFLVVGNAGTTNTGAVDDLPGARRARGAGASLVPRGRRLRRLLPAHGGRTAGAGGDRARRLDRPRPPQGSLPPLRDRRAARPRRRGPEARPRPVGRLHADDAGGGGPDRLQPAVAGALAGLPGVARLAAPEDARRRAVPRQPRGEARPGPVGLRAPAGDSGMSRSSRSRSSRSSRSAARVPGAPRRSSTRRTGRSSTGSTAAGASTSRARV